MDGHGSTASNSCPGTVFFVLSKWRAIRELLGNLKSGLSNWSQGTDLPRSWQSESGDRPITEGRAARFRLITGEPWHVSRYHL